MITADEKKICAAFGMTDEDYVKARNAEARLKLYDENPLSVNLEEKRICEMLGVIEADYVRERDNGKKPSALTDEEQKICDLMRVNKEDFIKERDAERTGKAAHNNSEILPTGGHKDKILQASRNRVEKAFLAPIEMKFSR